MKWSWKIARVAGIDIYMHATFLLLLAYWAVVGYRDSGTSAGAIDGVLFILAVFASVVAHEYGHALTARHYGVRTRGITLLPIGGIAQLERMPDTPAQELAIAIAGPAVTVAIIIVLYTLLTLTGHPVGPASEIEHPGAAFASGIMWTNVSLALFNLIPAFPMDGGRVLRAVLAMRTGDYVRATDRAASVGKAFALLFGIIGILKGPSPLLVLIALFVWMGAAAEASAVQARSVFHGVPVSRVMITDLRTLHPTDTLGHAVDYILAGFQQDFPVIDDGRIVGVLTRADLLKALAARGRDAWVVAAMDREFQTATPDEDLGRAFARLQACRCHTLPVVRGDELVGVLTTENIGEFLMIDAAMREARA